MHRTGRASGLKLGVNNAGGGNYQNLINDALREHIQAQNKSLEITLHKVIRDELQALKVV